MSVAWLLLPVLGLSVHRLDWLARSEWRLSVSVLGSTQLLLSVHSVCFGEGCELRGGSLLCNSEVIKLSVTTLVASGLMLVDGVMGEVVTTGEAGRTLT